METKIIETEDGAILKLIGRLDTKTSKDATVVFNEAGEKYNNITLDMEEVSYISSAGVRAIRNLYMILYRKEGTLKVEKPGDTVMQVFKMTGLATLFNFD